MPLPTYHAQPLTEVSVKRRSNDTGYCVSLTPEIDIPGPALPSATRGSWPQVQYHAINATAAGNYSDRMKSAALAVCAVEVLTYSMLARAKRLSCSGAVSQPAATLKNLLPQLVPLANSLPPPASVATL